jgi:hypothetical protein
MVTNLTAENSDGIVFSQGEKDAIPGGNTERILKL